MGCEKDVHNEFGAKTSSDDRRPHLQPRRDEKEQGNRVAPGTRNGRGWDLMVVIATVMVMVTTDTRSARQRCGARGWQTGRDSCCRGGRDARVSFKLQNHDGTPQEQRHTRQQWNLYATSSGITSVRFKRCAKATAVTRQMMCTGDAVAAAAAAAAAASKRTRIHEADSLVVELPKCGLEREVSGTDNATAAIVSILNPGFFQIDFFYQGGERKRPISATLDDEQHDLDFVARGAPAAARCELRR